MPDPTETLDQPTSQSAGTTSKRRDTNEATASITADRQDATSRDATSRELGTKKGRSQRPHQPIISQSVRIIADQMLLSSDQFVVAADISPILNEHGPGIYTIWLWGKPNHMSEPEVLSQQSIFWMTDPPKNSPYVRR